MNRRNFIKGVAFSASVSGAGKILMTHAKAAQLAEVPSYHRLFPDLPAAIFERADLERLASGDGKALKGMTAEPELLKDKDGKPLRSRQGKLQMSATPEDEMDDEENFGIPAGYTYLGQFVDHDLTFKGDDDFAILGASGMNARTPRFDLDSLYGAGPGLQPYLYEGDGRRLQRGRRLTHSGKPGLARDHVRIGDRALIGDKRNDENVLVSQMHGIFADFHNRVANDQPRMGFEALRRIVAWHYQWMLLTDFLPRLCGPELVAGLLPGFGENGMVGVPQPQLRFTQTMPAQGIPLEFTDAAYRFGHSMIRSVYRLNERMRGSDDEIRGNRSMAGRRAIFAAAENAGLNGFRSFPAEWAIDWNLYFETRVDLTTARIAEGPRRVQASYKIDTSLTNPLSHLPEFSSLQENGRLRQDRDGFPAQKPGAMSNLTLRNLVRGHVSGLPSGQDVALAMGLEPLADKDLRVGKASVEGLDENLSIDSYGESFRGRAPLWFYVLSEAQHDWSQRAAATTGTAEARNATPSRLGPVGARLVAETFIALMARDPSSVLHAPPTWRPAYQDKGRFGMVELVTIAGHG
jgi:hypothetical protein